MNFNTLKIYISLLLTLITPVNSLDQIELNKGYSTLITNYRLPALTIWTKKFIKATSFDSDVRSFNANYISLHHLAGNALHILNMHNDQNYFRLIKNRDIGYLDKTVIRCRNSEDDLIKIINILKKFNNSSILERLSMRSEIFDLEIEMEPYRTQRKLSSPLLYDDLDYSEIKLPSPGRRDDFDYGFDGDYGD